MILKEYSMKTKAINWERGSVYISHTAWKEWKEQIQNQVPTNWGPHKSNIKCSSVCFSPDSVWSPMSFGPSLPIFFDWELFHHWLRSSDPCSGESTFTLPLGAPKLLCCPSQPWSSGDDHGIHCSAAPNQGTSGDKVTWREKTPQGQQFPKAKSRGGTLALGWFIRFVGHQLFLQFISSCRV